MKRDSKEVELLSINEFLELTTLGRTTLYNLWERGEGPERLKVGKRVMIPTKSAKEWIEKFYVD